jgi:hypothetical protein
MFSGLPATSYHLLRPAVEKPWQGRNTTEVFAPTRCGAQGACVSVGTGGIGPPTEKGATMVKIDERAWRELMEYNERLLLCLQTVETAAHIRDYHGAGFHKDRAALLAGQRFLKKEYGSKGRG